MTESICLPNHTVGDTDIIWRCWINSSFKLYWSEKTTLITTEVQSNVGGPHMLKPLSFCQLNVSW